jgi:autotransporter-associated beta strand protein
LSSSGSLAVGGAGTTLDLGGSAQNVGVVSLSGGSITQGTLTGTSYALQTGVVSAALMGGGTLTKTSTGTLTLSGANQLVGTVDVQGGSLLLRNGGSLSAGSLLLSGGANIDLGATTQNVGLVVLNGGGRLGAGTLSSSAGFQLVSGTVDASLNGGTMLTKSGDTTVLLNAPNEYTGGTTLSGGTLTIGTAGALGASSGSLAVNGGQLNLGGLQHSVGVLSLAGGVISSTGSLTASSINLSSGSIYAVLNGAAPLTKAGPRHGAACRC